MNARAADADGRGAETPAELLPEAALGLVGHARAERVLFRAAAAGRMPHAWMFTGPKGVGKATLAFRLARFLLAGGATSPTAAPPAPCGPERSGETLSVPGAHPVVRRIAAGAHPDLLTVRRSPHPVTGRLRGEIVVEDARAVAHFFHKTAGEGGWRIAIVDSADELNRHAADAILKILEEPPRRSLLILVSHAPGRVPPTLRSRCAMLPLTALPDAEVADLLGARRPELDQGQRARLALLADGSPGRALALADAGGLELYGDLLSLLETLPALDVAALHRFADTFARREAKEAFATVTALLNWWLARLVRTAAGAGEDGGAEEGGDRSDLMRRLTRDGGLDRWAELWEKSARLFALAESANLDRKQVLLEAFFDIQAAAQA